MEWVPVTTVMAVVATVIAMVNYVVVEVVEYVGATLVSGSIPYFATPWNVN